MLVRNCDSHADSEHGLRCSGIEVLRRRGARDYRGRTVARGLTPVKRLQCCYELDVQIERKHLYASLKDSANLIDRDYLPYVSLFSVT